MLATTSSDRRDDAAVEGGEADAERLRGLLAGVDDSFDRSVELTVRRRHRDGSRSVPLLLLASASLPTSCHRSASGVHPYSNGEACLHRMMHLSLACYLGQ